MSEEVAILNETAVKRAYRRWAPFYDYTFAQVAAASRNHVVSLINKECNGRVLEVGVGTGLTLPAYKSTLTISGIDLSPCMLAKAHQRVEEKRLRNVAGLYEMDAGQMEFQDNSFDTVVAMYVMTVVPDPEKVMAELERVTAPGGEVILVNHFSQETGVRGLAERAIAPLANILGWRPVFPLERVMGRPGLQHVSTQALKPFGLFTMVRFRKELDLEEAERQTFMTEEQAASLAAHAGKDLAVQYESNVSFP